MIGTEVLGDIVVANPAAARVLDRYGIDYCCHGNRTLFDACEEAGADANEVAVALSATEPAGDTSWTELDPVALAAHILATHHAYLHDELPLLDALAEKVLGVHGERHPELAEVRRLVGELAADLGPHMLREEHILFPAISVLVAGGGDLPFGSIANPIRVMSSEHDRDGDLLRDLRRATADFVVPDDGCASYRSLYDRLEALEVDTHLHILKENHTLFPAALALEGA